MGVVGGAISGRGCVCVYAEDGSWCCLWLCRYAVCASLSLCFYANSLLLLSLVVFWLLLLCWCSKTFFRW